MHSRHAFMLAALVVMEFSALGQSQSGDLPTYFTLQVSAFADEPSARALADELERAGEETRLETADIPGRGQWVRVLVGTFQSYQAARQHGERLLARRRIRAYMVRGLRAELAATRPRRVFDASSGAWIAKEKRKPPTTARRGAGAVRPDLSSPQSAALFAAVYLESLLGETQSPLPRPEGPGLQLCPPPDPAWPPGPNPIRQALNFLVAPASPPAHPAGGLWLSGDVQQAFDYLGWILGERYADLLTLSQDGRVGLKVEELARRLDLPDDAPGASLIAAQQIALDEGLLLIAQLTEGPHRYLLHIGNPAPTRGGYVRVTGSINLDPNFDSRINLYRRNRRKLNSELPPQGFDAMVGLNPVARWFNLPASRIVPVGVIVFHELAEAHAKVALQLQYLGDQGRPGAHNLALEREQRLKSQRPLADLVLTTGSNRVLRSEEEIRQFYAEFGSALGNQR